mmetsp:Transcript_9663/g.29348  ORF Transcript_9663/g.29348 Transcript_9663/m.29348 type:complete len:224 (-) Transcript_9663:1599-2270(-)
MRRVQLFHRGACPGKQKLLGDIYKVGPYVLTILPLLIAPICNGRSKRVECRRPQGGVEATQGGAPRGGRRALALVICCQRALQVCGGDSQLHVLVSQIHDGKDGLHYVLELRNLDLPRKLARAVHVSQRKQHLLLNLVVVSSFSARSTEQAEHLPDHHRPGLAVLCIELQSRQRRQRAALHFRRNCGHRGRAALSTRSASHHYNPEQDLHQPLCIQCGEPGFF